MRQSCLKLSPVLLSCFYACPLFYRLYPPADFYDGVTTGIFLFTAIILLLYALFTPVRFRLSLNYLDIFVLLFLVYALANSVLKDPDHSFKSDNALLIIAMVLYIAFKNGLKNNYAFSSLFAIILFTGLVTQCYGFLQLFHLLPIINPQYKATGPFFNPNVFCTYLTVNFPLVVYNLVNAKKREVRILSGIFCINVFVFDVLLSSRAAFLGLVFICIILLVNISRSKKFRYSLLSILSMLLICGVLISSRIKPGSASGRLLIWKISARMLSANPLTGSGAGSYKSQYNNYQAQYFRTGKYSKQDVSLADENYESFNDLLTIGIEEGTIGLVLFAGIIFFVFSTGEASPDDKLIYIRCAIILLTGIGLFSYSMDEPFLFIEFITLPAIYSAISNNKELYATQGKYIGNAITLLAAIFCFYNYYYLNAWLNARQNNNSAVTKEKYKMIYEHLKNQPDFLLDYARISIAHQNYWAGAQLLKESISICPAPQSYSVLGIAYDRLGSHGNAENCLIRASMITPGKFSPKLMLMEYYDHINDSTKARKIAEEILQMKVKIPSMEVDFIKKLAGKRLQIKQ